VYGTSASLLNLIVNGCCCRICELEELSTGCERLAGYERTHLLSYIEICCSL